MNFWQLIKFVLANFSSRFSETLFLTEIHPWFKLKMMAKKKLSTNSLVTKTEFRKEMRGMAKTLRGEMKDMEIRLLGEISRSEMGIKHDMEEMRKSLVNQFFTGWDKLMKEVQAMRQEQAAHFLAHDRINETLASLTSKKQSVA